MYGRKAYRKWVAGNTLKNKRGLSPIFGVILIGLFIVLIRKQVLKCRFL